MDDDYGFGKVHQFDSILEWMANKNFEDQSDGNNSI